MSDREPGQGEQFDDEGNYILEDTGESLDDFSAEAAPPAADSESAVRQLREENASLRDQYVRKLADFENFRKRSEREKTEYFKYALGDFVRDLLPVLDNFDRALASSSDAPEEYRRGLELIQKDLMSTLRRYGVTPIEDTGVPFDPTMHEGILREENPDVPSHTVTQILQRGFFLHDRLVRPAMVKVAIGGPEPEQPATRSEEP